MGRVPAPERVWGCAGQVAWLRRSRSSWRDGAVVIWLAKRMPHNCARGHVQPAAEAVALAVKDAHLGKGAPEIQLIALSDGLQSRRTVGGRDPVAAYLLCHARTCCPCKASKRNCGEWALRERQRLQERHLKQTRSVFKCVRTARSSPSSPTRSMTWKEPTTSALSRKPCVHTAARHACRKSWRPHGQPHRSADERPATSALYRKPCVRTTAWYACHDFWCPCGSHVISSDERPTTGTRPQHAVHACLPSMSSALPAWCHEWSLCTSACWLFGTLKAQQPLSTLGVAMSSH